MSERFFETTLFKLYSIYFFWKWAEEHDSNIICCWKRRAIH